MEKSASPGTFSQEGQVLRYRFLVTNTGNVTLTDVVVRDELSGLSAIDCPRTELAPRQSQTCTASYSVTADDMTAGFVRNRAVAEGDLPGPRVSVTSAPSVATAYLQVPVTG